MASYEFSVFFVPYIVIYLRNKNQQDALIYPQFISVINIYMLRAGLLLIVRRYLSVYTVTGMCHALCWLAASKVGSFTPILLAAKSLV